MLIEFSVKNFLSFKDKVTLSMVASKDDSLPQNVIKSAQGTDLNLLKSAVIYGANASGKSNFVESMKFMRDFVLHSSRSVNKEITINRKRFKLDEAYSKKPSEFEVVFLWEGVRYIYGFKIDDKSVSKEWFYFYPKGQQSLLFERSSNTGDVKRDYKWGTKFKGGKKSLALKTKKHSLFISVAAQFNNKIAEIVVNWFTDHLRSVGDAHSLFIEQTFTIKNALNNKHIKEEVFTFIKEADIDIEDIKIEHSKRDENVLSAVREMFDKITPEGERPMAYDEDFEMDYSVSTIHRGKNTKGRVSMIPLKLDEESDGTQKLFSIAGPWLFVLDKGILMVFDEFDIRLHPLLSENLVNMFNSDSANKNNAQLIITTHNTDLLDKNIFRRDQVWFANKSHETGSSSLYSLWDFKKKARKSENFRKNYMAGRYGAIPILERFEK